MSGDTKLSDRANNSRQKWTKAEEDQLCRLAEDRKSTQEVAKVLGRTQQAVAHRANKLGFTLRYAPRGPTTSFRAGEGDNIG